MYTAGSHFLQRLRQWSQTRMPTGLTRESDGSRWWRQLRQSCHPGHDGAPYNPSAQRQCLFLIPEKRWYILGATLGCGKPTAITPTPVAITSTSFKKGQNLDLFFHENLLAFNFWETSSNHFKILQEPINHPQSG